MPVKLLVALACELLIRSRSHFHWSTCGKHFRPRRLGNALNPANSVATMAKYKLEYIWLDGYQPLASLRSKTQIKEFASFPKLEELPNCGL
jgi:hypothetical protein